MVVIIIQALVFLVCVKGWNLGRIQIGYQIGLQYFLAAKSDLFSPLADKVWLSGHGGHHDPSEAVHGRSAGSGGGR